MRQSSNAHRPSATSGSVGIGHRHAPRAHPLAAIRLVVRAGCSRPRRAFLSDAEGARMSPAAYAEIVNLENVVVDATDPQTLGRFWETALGTETLTDEPDGFETRLTV